MTDDLPEPFRRLLELIEKQPGKLEARNAQDLLREAGLGREFEDLFGVAGYLGLNIQVFAAIVLAALLRGTLRERLSTEARRAAKDLQVYADQAEDAIRKVGQHGTGLARVMSEALGHEVFRPEEAHATIRMLERLPAFRDLLQHLHACVERMRQGDAV